MQFGQQILATILLLYHILIWAVDDRALQVCLSLVLYGLFLLWQPLWSKEAKYNQTPIIVTTSLFVLLTYSYPEESLILFGLILAGLIGSRLLSRTEFRSFDLLALSILILEITIGLIPAAFAQVNIPALFARYMNVVILVPVLLFYLAPNPDPRKQQRSQVDLMHGLLTATLLFIVLLGGIVTNLLYDVDYIDGLLLTVFIVATLTMGISWFWNPGIGYSGIGALWNRYTMTIGGPFESWINTLTTLIEEPYLSSSDFLEAACENLTENDWLNGIEWNFENFRISAAELIGTRLEHALTDKINVVLYFKADPGKALEQHTSLLIRMAYQFYLAKVNQEKIRAQEHFATIHHTGARLTHDIKNILQSIKTSASILDMSGDVTSQQKLLQTNLRQISSRLENTLDKLKLPKLQTQLRLVSCNKWVYQISQTYQTESRVKIHSEIDNNLALPADLFDSVIENLIGNALRKASAKRIDVRLLVNSSLIILSVCDDGEAMDNDIENSLFEQPVSSGSGMGIGLYQAAIMARASNYELALNQNESGRVCFGLYQHLSG